MVYEISSQLPHLSYPPSSDSTFVSHTTVLFRSTPLSQYLSLSVHMVQVNQALALLTIILSQPSHNTSCSHSLNTFLSTPLSLSLSLNSFVSQPLTTLLARILITCFSQCFSLATSHNTSLHHAQQSDIFFLNDDSSNNNQIWVGSQHLVS